MIEKSEKGDSEPEDLLFQDETFAIRGCCFDVYMELPLFAEEALYQEAMCYALQERRIPFEAQKLIKVMYHGRALSHYFKLDLLCYGKIIVELKAVNALIPEHFAQVRNYLALTGLKLGLLVNFHHFPGVEIRRVRLADTPTPKEQKAKA